MAIYQGLADTLPAVPLSRVYQIQPLAVAALPPYYQDRVRGNIEVPSLESARVTVAELTEAAKRCATPPPTPTPAPTPTARLPRLLRRPRRRPTTTPALDRPPPHRRPTTTPSPSGGPVAPEC